MPLSSVESRTTAARGCDLPLEHLRRVRLGDGVDPAAFSWERCGAELVLRVHAEVGLGSVDAFRRAVELLVESCEHPVLDLAGAVVDAGGVEVLLAAGRRLAARERCLLVEAPAPLTARLLRWSAPHPGVLVGAPSRAA